MSVGGKTLCRPVCRHVCRRQDIVQTCENEAAVLLVVATQLSVAAIQNLGSTVNPDVTAVTAITVSPPREQLYHNYEVDDI